MDFRRALAALLFLLLVIGFVFAGTPGTAARTLPTTYTAGTPMKVSIYVTPVTGTTVYGVAETFPANWTVNDTNCVIVSTGASCKGTETVFTTDIEWNLGDSLDRNLSYTITPSSSGTNGSFSGSVEDYNTTGHTIFNITGASSTTRIPLISAVTTSVVGTTTATITWMTDVSSDSNVEYGTSTSYGASASTATMVASHSQSLSGLASHTLYHYRVKSKDASGNLAMSGDYAFSTSNMPPSIVITSPTPGTLFTSPASFDVNTSPTDTDGLISNVKFYLDGNVTPFATITASPYSTRITNLTGSGSHTITATATDNDGATGSATVTIKINNPPTASITSPANNATYTALASITIMATANDSDGTISKVDFNNGSTLLASITAYPYTYTWTSVPVGTYNLTATATDNNGAKTVSSIVTVTVTALSVFNLMVTKAGLGSGNVTVSPVGGNCGTGCYSYNSGTSVQLTAGNDGNSVFVSWGGSINSSTNPYTLTMDGNKAITATFNDTQAPTISSVAASAITTSGATITWSTNEASDSQVDYGLTVSYGSSTVLNSSMVTSHSQVLSSIAAHTLYHYRVKSKDQSGNPATSTDYNFTTTNTQPVANAKSVSTNEDANLSIALTGSDADGDVITYAIVTNPTHGTLVGLNTSTGVVTYAPASLYKGTDSFTFKVNDGRVDSPAATVTITVIAINYPPTVSITYPAVNATFTAPLSIDINATASDKDGTITSVAFYDQSTLLGTDTATPYNFHWTHPAAGTHILVAVATDNNNAQTTSSAVSITITNLFHPADTRKDWNISQNEYLAYANCYKQGDGCNWNGTGKVTQNYLLNAMNIVVIPPQTYKFTTGWDCITSDASTCWWPGS